MQIKLPAQEYEGDEEDIGVEEEGEVAAVLAHLRARVAAPVAVAVADVHALPYHRSQPNTLLQRNS